MLSFEDGSETLPIGVDDVHRVSRVEGFDEWLSIPGIDTEVGARGEWQSDGIFVVDMVALARLDAYLLSIDFDEHGSDVTMSLANEWETLFTLHGTPQD